MNPFHFMRESSCTMYNVQDWVVFSLESNSGK